METVAKNMIVLFQIWILKNAGDSNNESNNLITKMIRITFLIRIARSLCPIKFFSRFTRAVKLGKQLKRPSPKYEEPPVSAHQSLIPAVLFHIFSIRAKTTACRSSSSFDQFSSSLRWEAVRDTDSSPSANSWDSVIPKAVQIFSSDGTVGIIFLRYQDEIVDWGKPDSSAS